MQPANALTRLSLILSNEPRLLRELLGAGLSALDGVTVVAETPMLCHLPGLARTHHPQWIVLSLDENGCLPPITDAIVAMDPDVGILAIAADGQCIRCVQNGRVRETSTWRGFVQLIREPPASDGPASTPHLTP
ncbi:MAG: hypothetical protein R2834_03220 [Rhodothermales bacterium]